MTQITRDDVLRLAKLSSLQLTESEIENLATDISNILGYVEQLDELDTENVEPTYQVTDLSNIWREDAVADNSVSRGDLLSLAPSVTKDQIKVPKVL